MIYPTLRAFMTDYLGLLAYSDWLRDQGKEEEALAFLDSIVSDNAWGTGSDFDFPKCGVGYGDFHYATQYEGCNGQGSSLFSNSLPVTNRGDGYGFKYNR